MNHLSVTTWKNPTPHVQRFRLHGGPGEEPMEVVIKPDDSAQVLSKYDRAIRTERDGVVVGGLAPLLVPKGREQVPVHEAIAKAAAMGDDERKLVQSTGASAGGSSLNALMALEAKNAALEAKLEAVMAMMAAGSAPPVDKSPSKPQQPAQNAPPKG